MEGVSAVYVNYPDLPELWVLASQEPRHIPTFPAVYIILDANRYVKYVGQTTNLRSRYKDHLKKVIKEGDAIGWLKCEQEELMFLECWFIATLRPYLNGNAHKRSRRAATEIKVRLSVKPEPIWRVGRKVYFHGGGYLYSEFDKFGVIQKILKPYGYMDRNCVLVDGHSVHKSLLSVVLD